MEKGMFDFGMALKVLKGGNKVARKGWNGKDMWLALISPEGYGVKCIPAVDRGLVQLPWIGMKTADNKFVPWLASQTDILAEDWCIVMTEGEVR